MAKKPRKLRREINKIPSHVTEEYLRELDARDFLTQDGVSPYHDGLTEEEKVLFKEFKKCDCNFEKWVRFRKERK